MNYYNSQSSHNRHSHKKTTLVADNHLKLVTWIDNLCSFKKQKQFAVLIIMPFFTVYLQDLKDLY